MILRLMILAGVLVLSSMPSAARPVSYPGGWTFMTMNNGERYSAHLHYSPTAYTSVGYRAEYRRDEEYQIHAVQMNNLLRRWNMPDAQANLYLKSGAGVAYSDAGEHDGRTAPAGFTGIAADWENRRYFVSYENRYLHAGSMGDAFTQSARVGIAPYIGDYGDLHTWLMLEIDHNPEAGDPVTLTPLVRLFRGVHLVEFGVSDNRDVLFNYVIRY